MSANPTPVTVAQADTAVSATVPSSPPALTAPPRRKSRWFRLTPWRLALGLVVVPMLIAGVYLGALAQDRFVSTSIITVRRASSDTSSVNGLSMLLPGVATASQEDTRFLRDYLHSLALMNRLDARLHLRAHFEAPRTDWLWRLWPGSSQEQMLEYWRSRVEVTFDEFSGLLTLRVQGFEPGYAQQLNQALLQEAEAFINSISHRIASDQMAFAQNELSRAETRLHEAQQAMIAFQNEHQMLDPGVEAHASNIRTEELRGQLVKFQAELSAKLAFLNDDAPDIVTLKAQIQAVQQQLERETREATSTSTSRRPSKEALTGLAMQFNALKTHASLAEGAYKSALASVEATRIEASRKVKTVVVIEPPTQAQTAEFPRRLYSLSTLLLICLMVWGVAHLTVATVQEHRD